MAKKKATYVQSKTGMRQLMSTDPIRSMVNQGAAQVMSRASAIDGRAQFIQWGEVTGYPNRGEPISWHSFIGTSGDTYTHWAQIKHDILQKALNG